MRKPVFISSVIFLLSLGCSFDPTGLAYLEDSSVNNLPDADTDIQTDTDGSSEDIQDINDINDADEDGDISCTAEDTACLDFNQLQLCKSNGDLITVNCEFGCNDQVTPNTCLNFVPSNDLDLSILLNQDLETTTFDLNASFNTDNGEILVDDLPFRAAGEGMDLATGIHFEIHEMADETQAGTFSFNILKIKEGAVVDVYGSKSIIIRANSLFLKGIIDLSASSHKCEANNNRCAGPGGFSGGPANTAGNGPGKGYRGEKSWGIGDETGGGGAGYLSAGGSGGGSDGGEGGNVYGNDFCEPLTGGSGGGGGGHINGAGNTDTSQGRGGGGGGAVQITIKNYLEIGNATGDPCGINANAAGGSGNDHYLNSGGGGSMGRIIVYDCIDFMSNGVFSPTPIMGGCRPTP
jgi:hypothetical protein